MRNFLILPGLFIINSLFAGIIDSTIFDSKFEQNNFEKVVNSESVSDLNLLISLNYKEECNNYSLKINEFVNEFKSINSSSNTGKQLKNLYKAVHAAFFKKYSEETYFNEIFINGNYNCVTASALYAIILDQLSINYSLKMTPDHVYLIADTNNTKFQIETTLPSHGVWVYDDKTKRNYVKYLIDNKLISTEEYNSQTVDALFTKYYTTDKSIKLRELCGIQYYNKSVFLARDNKYRVALRDIEKAELLFPDNQIKYLKFSILSNILDDQNEKKDYEGKYLGKFMNCNRNNSNSIYSGTEYFKAVSNEMVINHSDINKYKKYYNEFQINLDDSIDYPDIQQTYYSLIGYYYYTISDYKSALNFLQKTYKINPDNIQTKNLILESMGKLYMQVDKTSDADMDTIIMFFDKFPLLKQNELFQAGYIESLAYLIMTSSTNKNSTKENYYIGKLDSLLKENPVSKEQNEIIENIFLFLAEQYYYKNESKTAIEKLKTGLSLIPNSLNLDTRLKYMRAHPSYNQVVYVTPNNNKSVNQKFYEFGFKKWEITNYTYYTEKNGKSEPNKIVFKLMESGKVIFYKGSATSVGKWNFNESSHYLYLKSENKIDNWTIAIHQMNATEIKGVLITSIPKDVIIKVVKE
jgi:tetratricopeptide (TPR) repeat protein